MLLKELIKNIYIKKSRGNLNIDIKGIKYDSRMVVSGDIFICISGYKTDGHNYIKSALKNGAVAIFVEKDVNISSDVTVIKVSDTRAVMADLAACFYDNPSYKIKLIGVTGTNGKTTTTYLIKNILEREGYNVGILGTISNTINNEVISAERTTPESVDLQYLLDKMVKMGADYVVMEVSSHALKLCRVKNCKFRAAVFTNISQDHLDFHNDINEYVEEKKKLFEMLPVDSYGVINKDDEYYKIFKKASKESIFSFSIDNNSDFKAYDIKVAAEGVSYCVDYFNNKSEINLNLTGLFNIYNSLAAYVVAYNEGVSIQVIKEALSKLQSVPGRFEKIECNQDFTIIVDYAHTPDSLENILKTAKKFAKKRIITVFGCGGDRDSLKRPLMGEKAALHSDICIITSDNPRSENPEKIIEDIRPGVEKFTKEYLVEIDRKMAIEKTLKLCKKNDILIIAGKGHETYQEINGNKVPFDDKLIVRNYFTNGEKNDEI